MKLKPLADNVCIKRLEKIGNDKRWTPSSQHRKRKT